MIITEKEMVHKALKLCWEEKLKLCWKESTCAQCPYYEMRNCLEFLEHKATELYIVEHPEIFNDKEVVK